MWWVIVVIVFTAGTSEGRKRNVIDTCVILGDNVTDDIMESFRLANEAVLDKLSPPLRLGINKTDIYREGRGFSYDNTKYGMCFFIAGPGDRKCRAPLKKGQDISYIFKSFCHSTSTGHTLINTRGKICVGQDLHNVAVIKLPDTANGTDHLENIIASLVLYKLGIEVYNNETDLVLRPGSPGVQWLHFDKLDSDEKPDRNLTLVGPADSWWNRYTKWRMEDRINGTFRCLWSEEVTDKMNTLATTTATTSTMRKTSTTDHSSTTSPVASTTETTPELENKFAEDTDYDVAYAPDHSTDSYESPVTPSEVKAEAKNETESTFVLVYVGVGVVVGLSVIITVFIRCFNKKRSHHFEEKADTEKMVPEVQKFSDASHEVDVDRAIMEKGAQFINTSYSSSEAPVSPGSSPACTPV